MVLGGDLEPGQMPSVLIKPYTTKKKKVEVLAFPKILKWLGN
jgi:hypothetical protein